MPPTTTVSVRVSDMEEVVALVEAAVQAAALLERIGAGQDFNYEAARWSGEELRDALTALRRES